MNGSQNLLNLGGIEVFFLSDLIAAHFRFIDIHLSRNLKLSVECIHHRLSKKQVKA